MRQNRKATKKRDIWKKANVMPPHTRRLSRWVSPALQIAATGDSGHGRVRTQRLIDSTDAPMMVQRRRKSRSIFEFRRLSVRAGISAPPENTTHIRQNRAGSAGGADGDGCFDLARIELLGIRSLRKDSAYSLGHEKCLLFIMRSLLASARRRARARVVPSSLLGGCVVQDVLRRVWSHGSHG